MPSLCSLPVEIIHLILDYTSKPELLNLCLTNQQTSKLAQPRLFRCFSCYDPTEAVKYCLTISSRPDLALAVRDLGFFYRQYVVLPKGFWESFLQATSFMSNLTAMRFSRIPSDSFLRDATFPQLKFFSIVIYFTPEVIKFLDRHPTIIDLGSDFYCDGIPDVGPEFLPSLRRYTGAPLVAEKLVPGRPVTELFLVWTQNTSQEQMFDIIKTVSSSSIPILQFSCTTFHTEQTAIPFLTTIAQYLPSLRSLCLSNVSSMKVLDQTFLDSMTYLLPRLENIQRLLIPFNNTQINAQLTPGHLEDKLPVEWKKLCPKLDCVMFPSGQIYTYDASLMVWARSEHIPPEPKW